MNLVGKGFDRRPQESGADHAAYALMELHIGKLGDPADRQERMQLAP